MRFGSACGADDTQSYAADSRLEVSLWRGTNQLQRPVVDSSGLRVDAFVNVDSGDVCVCETETNTVCFASSDRLDRVAAAAPTRRIIVGGMHSGVINAIWWLRPTVAALAALPSPRYPIWFETQGRQRGWRRRKVTVMCARGEAASKFSVAESAETAERPGGITAWQLRQATMLRTKLGSSSNGGSSLFGACCCCGFCCGGRTGRSRMPSLPRDVISL